MRLQCPRFPLSRGGAPGLEWTPSLLPRTPSVLLQRALCAREGRTACGPLCLPVLQPLRPSPRPPGGVWLWKLLEILLFSQVRSLGGVPLAGSLAKPWVQEEHRLEPVCDGTGLGCGVYGGRQSRAPPAGPSRPCAASSPGLGTGSGHTRGREGSYVLIICVAGPAL